MAQVLVRRLEEKVVKLLKQNAKAAGRSLEEECRVMLDRGARLEHLSGEMERWKLEDEGIGEEPDPWEGVRLRSSPRATHLE